jgi:hypothetical protein
MTDIGSLGEAKESHMLLSIFEVILPIDDHEIDQPPHVIGALDCRREIADAARIEGVVVGMIDRDDNKAGDCTRCCRIVMAAEPPRPTM